MYQENRTFTKTWGDTRIVGGLWRVPEWRVKVLLDQYYSYFIVSSFPISLIDAIKTNQ